MKNLPLGRLGVGGRCVGGSELLCLDVGNVANAWSIFSVDRGNPIDLGVGLLGRFSSWVVKLVTMIHQSIRCGLYGVVWPIRCGNANTTHYGMWFVFTVQQG